jgi:F0F1-type ATP synthase delta subunit
VRNLTTGSRKLKSLAKGLVRISLNEHSLVDAGRVRILIGILEERYDGSDLKHILLSYLDALEKFVAATTLTIEHSGEISPQAIGAIRSHFEKMLGRSLAMHIASDDSLIAGIRVSIRDIVLERSIVGTLNAYSKRMRRESSSSF